MAFDVSQILNLVGQLGGDHQQAAQQLHGMSQVDPQQHSGILSTLGLDTGRLAGGGYQQHLDAQQRPGFTGYQQDGSEFSQQRPDFSGYGQQQGFGQQGFEQGEQGYGQQYTQERQEGGRQNW